MRFPPLAVLGVGQILVPTLAAEAIAPVNPQPLILEADVKARGLLDFPQAEATVLHDDDALRVSAWNDAKWVYAQTVLWGDNSNHVGPMGQYQRTRDTSTLYVESDGDLSVAERRYTLNGTPFVLGLRWQNWMPDHKIWSGLSGDGKEFRGAIRYARTPDGRRVRVDSLLIPLGQWKVAPGATIHLAVEATSPVPALTVKSVKSLNDRTGFPEFTLADRPATRAGTPSVRRRGGRVALSGLARVASLPPRPIQWDDRPIRAA